VEGNFVDDCVLDSLGAVGGIVSHFHFFQFDLI
jgi:hypothetical protein